MAVINLDKVSLARIEKEAALHCERRGPDACKGRKTRRQVPLHPERFWTGMFRTAEVYRTQKASCPEEGAMSKQLSRPAPSPHDGGHWPTGPVLAGLPRLLPDLVKLYKDVHSHPELSMQETRTAGIAAKRLKASGFEVTTGVGQTGVVGLLRNGDGPTVMLRADMDALPIKEATGLAYASQVTATGPDGKTVPVAHSCGHDMHVACLAGSAALFAEHPDGWKGTLMAVFQPGEETAEGAQAMIDDGLFKRFAKP
ncbi:MAG TPA: M20/M25/M40 family metallo-hydrolase, partial [Gemmataceae bacterium]|nr:M20/M25/M40 family metallo-hydrolase [Gemmataceae bacterium]